MKTPPPETIDIDAARREAARHLARGATADALKSLERAFRLAPTDAALLFNIAAVLHNDNRAELALTFFKRALLVDPGFVTSLAHTTMATARASGPAPALRLARYLGCLVPLSAQARALIAQYNFELERHALVPSLARRALVLDPSVAGLYRLIGLSQAILQDLEGAARGLALACVLQPDWADARLSLAGALLATTDFEGALRNAEDAAARGAYPAEAAFIGARACLALDRREEAEALFDKAIALEPSRQRAADIARLTVMRADFVHYHAQRPEKDAL